MWRGSHFYRTTASSGKLAFLNNVVGVFEVEIDRGGKFFREDLGMEVNSGFLFSFLTNFYPASSAFVIKTCTLPGR